MMPFFVEILELATAGMVLAAAMPFLKKSSEWKKLPLLLAGVEKGAR